jgi:hypothetical protein
MHPTVLFYSVQSQTIFLIKWRVLPLDQWVKDDQQITELEKIELKNFNHLILSLIVFDL